MAAAWAATAVLLPPNLLLVVVAELRVWLNLKWSITLFPYKFPAEILAAAVLPRISFMLNEVATLVGAIWGELLDT